jgi:gluconokinase
LIVVVMGVSDSGKSTIGKLLAEELGWTFVEGDEFHPEANVAKMRQGVPLNDEDRGPWLNAIRHRLEQAAERGENVVLACSALKHAYQHYLEHYAAEDVQFVYLHASAALIRKRLAERKGHFMNPALFKSQFDALEPPENAIRVNADGSPERIAAEIRRHLEK